MISVQREGGFALDKVAGYVVDTVMRVAVDGIDQVSCRTPSDGFGFVVDRRQCGPRAGGQYRPVIVADDGDVIRDAQSLLLEHVNAAAGQLIVLADHCIELDPLVEQQAGGGAAPAFVPFAVTNWAGGFNT